MIRLILKEVPYHRALAESALSDLLTMAGVAPDADLAVYYGEMRGKAPDVDIFIPAVIGCTADTTDYRVGIERVAVPIIYKVSGEPIKLDGDCVIFGFDVLRAAAEMISEEPDFRVRTDFGRPVLDAESVYRREILSVPTVNLCAMLLRKALKEVRPNVLQPLWPDEAPYAVLLSHDVDRIVSGPRMRRLREALGSLKRNERIHNVNFFAPSRLYDSITKILAAERRYGAVSTFFFSAIRRGPIDPDYDVQDVAGLMAEVNAAGCEVALHPGFYCPDADGLKDEIDNLESVLGEKITGLRGHFLQPEPPECFNRSEAIGLQYDATPGFPAATAFRYGATGPFTPWNAAEMRPYGLTAIPMMCMDGTLYRYLGMNRNQALERIFTLMDIVRASGGAFSLLWHSDTFAGGSKPKWTSVYREVLHRAAQDGAVFMSHRDCAEWYKGRKVAVKVIENQ